MGWTDSRTYCRCVITKISQLIRKIKSIGRILRTISHLKPIQVAYQLKYRLISPKPLAAYKLSHSTFKLLSFFDTPNLKIAEVNGKAFKFRFLNLSYTFEESIDWNYQAYGKLWNYNLQYMDWLKQETLPSEKKNFLAVDLYSKLWEGYLPLEPYPASLRIMNGIRYLSTSIEASHDLAIFIKAEVNFLTNRLEYHLLANHLLENAFAIYMAGCFFQDSNWLQLGDRLLRDELDEQILKDGAHYELSPMYHQIIFFRVLELMAYENRESEFYSYVEEKAYKMLSWLKAITFRNGSIPHFNDSTDGIALTSLQLYKIAEDLGLEVKESFGLKESGYRKFVNDKFELIVDVHGISPAYQPGHAHADTFSFCLNFEDEPIIVDTGISTYNICSDRADERGTSAHNTVVINNSNSAEVWSGFRVGKRIETKLNVDKEKLLFASHKGYLNFGVEIKRKFDFSDYLIEISDSLSDKQDQAYLAESILHLHPSVEISSVLKSSIILNRNLEIMFKGQLGFQIEDSAYCIGFNKRAISKKIRIKFKDKQVNIKFTPIL